MKWIQVSKIYRNLFFKMKVGENKLNIQKYLYHGLCYSTDNIFTIENIFQTGYLMKRNPLKNILNEEEWNLFQREHSTNWNGLDAVSVVCHIKNQELIEKYHIVLPEEEKDNSYQQFIKNVIVLCLDPSILEVFPVKENTRNLGLEIQIMGNIPVSYIRAIALNLSNAKKCFSTKDIFIFKKVLKELKQNYLGKNFYQYYDQTFYLRYIFHRYSLHKIYKEMIIK